MSKAVPLDHEFNKKKFAELLERAKGNRTQTQFAQDCGLSVSHLNRYFNSKKDLPPIPATIIKIALNAENDVTSLDLLDAAGYDPEKNYTLYQTDVSTIKDAIMHDCEFILQISLFHTKFKWSNFSDVECSYLLEDNGQAFGIEIDNSDVLKHWFFETEYFYSMRDRSVLFDFYGRLCCKKMQPKTKVSLVVCSDEAFDIIKANPPIMLPIYFSVIIMEPNINTYISEKYVPTALELTDDLKTIFTFGEKEYYTNSKSDE